MSDNESSGAREQLSMISLAPFLLITFVIAWGILGLYMFNNDGMKNTFGQLSGNHPLFFLAVWAPAIAAFAVIAFKEGLTGVKRFASRFLLFRCSVQWYLFILIGIPLVFYIGAGLKGTLFTEPLPVSGIFPIVSALLLSAIKGPVEEFGWRGFALPILQRVFAPIWSAIILGIAWGIWHLPAFLISGTQQSAWSFTPFLLGTITISVLITIVFNASRGSVFLSALMHFQFMNPIWPDAQPYDTYVLVIVTLVTVWLNRKAMFTREGAITGVIEDSNGNSW